MSATVESNDFKFGIEPGFWE